MQGRAGGRGRSGAIARAQLRGHLALQPRAVGVAMARCDEQRGVPLRVWQAHSSVSVEQQHNCARSNFAPAADLKVLKKTISMFQMMTPHHQMRKMMF